MVPAAAWAQAPCSAAGTVTPVQRALPPGLAPCPLVVVPPPARSTGEGVGVYAAAIALGVGAGAAITELADIDDTFPALAVPAALGGVGAGAMYLAERLGGPMRPGRGAAMSNGVLVGLTAGTLLGMYGDFRLRWDSALVVSSVAGGAALGAVVGYGLGAALDARPASASLVGSGGLWGAALGLSVGLMADVRENDYPIAGMVGQLVGVGAAAALAGTLRPTEAQVRWMDVGVLLGAVAITAPTIALASGSYVSSLVVPGVLAGAAMIGGGILGYTLSRPSPVAAPRTAARDRFSSTLSIAPLPGGAQVMLSLPNLL